MSRSIFVAVALACSVPAVAGQQLPSPDPIVGSWKLNLSRSKFPPNAAPKEHTEIYRVSADRVEFTLTRIGTNGMSTFKATWPAEGGIAVVVEDATPIPDWTAIETLMAPGEWYVTQMQNGKQIFTIHKVVSKDGKTMRQTLKGLDPQGRPVESLQMFDRN
jgi:hypothetical protein